MTLHDEIRALPALEPTDHYDIGQVHTAESEPWPTDTTVQAIIEGRPTPVRLATIVGIATGLMVAGAGLHYRALNLPDSEPDHADSYEVVALDGFGSSTSTTFTSPSSGTPQTVPSTIGDAPVTPMTFGTTTTARPSTTSTRLPVAKARATSAPTTAAPTTAAPTTSSAPQETATTTAATADGCHPNYKPCLSIVADLNCDQIRHAVTIIGADPYGLDQDGNGIGCQEYPPPGSTATTPTAAPTSETGPTITTPATAAPTSETTEPVEPSTTTDTNGG